MTERDTPERTLVMKGPVVVWSDNGKRHITSPSDFGMFDGILVLKREEPQQFLLDWKYIEIDNVKTNYSV